MAALGLGRVEALGEAELGSLRCRLGVIWPLSGFRACDEACERDEAF